MRGNQLNKWRTLSGTLILMTLAIWLSGCSILQEWNSNALAGPGIADAATPTGTASPTEPAQSPDPTPDAVTKPSGEQTVPTPPPAPVDKDKYKGRKLVALTFDDGPDGKYTAQILDVLRDYNVKATFFLVGQQVNKYPEVAQRIVEEGHSIGNHSWSHKDLTKLSSKARDEEIDKTQQAILKATGVTPQLMRAPYGALSDSVLKSVREYNMKHVFWTVDTRDWAGTSVSEMYKNVLTHTRQGGVILMHSFGGRKHAIEHTIKLLPSIIEDLGAKGYEFATVDELIESGQSLASVIK